MRSKRALYLGVAAIGIVGFFAPPGKLSAQTTVAIDADDIGGVVTGPEGPEAGVWVIAETTDLGTKMAKMVVTDDQGRYVIPDLPKAKYKVWVRGYGLVDSPKVDSEPGKQLNLTAVEGAQRGRRGGVLSGDLLVLDDQGPGADQFPGTGPNGNGISPGMKTPGPVARRREDQWLRRLATSSATRRPATIPAVARQIANGYEAWTRRIQSGQASPKMVNNVDRMGTQGALKMFGDWTDRVAARRTAGREAAAAARHRAQRRHDGMGLVEPEGLPA